MTLNRLALLIALALPHLLHAADVVPGVVIDHVAASTGQYIGSPSLAVLADGTYVASHDLFGPKSTRDTTVLFRSADRGQTWERLGTIRGAWWSSLFVHRGALYLMGPDREYGHVVIRRSTDGGKTWTEPRDGNTGLLLADGKYHTAPCPVVVHDGRIWRAMEDAMGPGGWGSHFRAFMMSAPQDADLLRAESWTRSNPIARDPAWLDGKFGGWLEGNAVVTPDGHVVDLLRVDQKPDGGFAALVDVTDDGKTARFDPAAGFIRLPGGAKKFTVRFDDVTKRYWTLSNYIPPEDANPNPSATRNTLALCSSADLRQWTVERVILHHPDRKRHGFQYVDWLFDGDDLIAVSRTAFDDDAGGAHSAHDANYMTFHRIRGFRKRATPAQ